MPTFTILDNNFKDIVAFLSGTYPEHDYTQSVITTSSNSNNAPEVSPVSAIVMLCSLCHNPYSSPTTILYSFPPEGSFGQEISIQPPEIIYTDCKHGAFSSLDIEFLDQNLNPISILDKAITVQLSIKNKHKENLS